MENILISLKIFYVHAKAKTLKKILADHYLSFLKLSKKISKESEIARKDVQIMALKALNQR